MSTRSERIRALIEQSGKSYQELEKLVFIRKRYKITVGCQTYLLNGFYRRFP